jgi:isopenicillin-N N-acyltransferase like protein
LNDLLVIEATGSHYEIGFKVGKTARPRLISSLENYRRILPREGWKGPWILPGGYLAAAQETFPHLVEELQGMADGSGLDFQDLFFLNSLEEALDLKPPQACTAVAVSSAEGVWLGHNEDWYSEDAGSVIALYARPRGKPAFISITAAPFLSAVGVNEAGLAQGVNSLTSTDCRVGVPRVFSSRAVLEAATIDQARAAAAPANRAGGYNHLLAHAGGEIGSLETTACEAHYTAAEKVIYHTNHYVSRQLKPLEKDATAHSLARYSRLKNLEKILTDQPFHYKQLAEILSDHGNRPRSICRHGGEQEGPCPGATIFSVLMEPATFSVYAAAGNPCRSPFRKLVF